MPKYPMTDVIASREYVLAEMSERVPISIAIGRPAPLPEGEGGWYCPFRITGAGDVQRTFAVGEDSVQALLLALSAVHAILGHRARDGNLMFLGGASGSGITVS